MEIERNGITFDVTYFGARRGTRDNPPEHAEIEISGWHVSDWDELADYFGTGSGGRAFSSVDDIAEWIMDCDYNYLLERAEGIALDEFDEPEYDKYDDDGKDEYLGV